MRKATPILALLLTAAVAAYGADRAGPEFPYEVNARPSPENRLDALVLASLKRRGMDAAYLCSDAVFLRRVYLDVIGALPDPRDARAWLADQDPGKRARLIDDLLADDRFADYWAMKWCDLLRVKAEFPINLWPNAAQAYHRWIRDAVRANRPYDQFVRDLLTSSGSNFRVPPVNFYRAIQGRTPHSIADAAALTFMGTRPTAWSDAQRAGLAAFFSRVAYKQTAEWKEEIVYLDPAPRGTLDAAFPDGKPVRIPDGEDPRRVFADWLVRPDNPWFARNAVNRVWSWLLGRGIIHEPDDIRPDNPPSNPELLAFLEREFVAANFDLRHIYRLILNSGVYQQSPIPRSDHPDAERLFAFYKVRRLEAEVLADALYAVTGAGETYSSPIPEPFTFLPEDHPSVAIPDGSITSSFLELFGRPARDTGLESERDNNPSAGQRLYLLNSSSVQRRIEQSRKINGLIAAARGNRRTVIQGLYLSILSRYATPEELAEAEKYSYGRGGNPVQGAQDLAWALINTKEFLYRH